MKALPKTVKPYKRTPDFGSDTIPAGLTGEHATKGGTWGVITVALGSLRYIVPSLGLDVVLTPGRPGIVEPTVVHRVEPCGDVSFFVEFYR